MAADAKKWLLGCGIGCASLVLISVVGVIVIAGLIRREFQGVEGAIESHRELSDRYGEVEDFVPPPDGAVPADRMEVFLAVRESAAGQGEKLESSLSGIQGRIEGNDDHSFRSAVRIIANLGGLISPIGEYVQRRNEALMAKGMGLGEYLYIYSLAYYSWLGHSPADGPVTRRRSSDAKMESLFEGDSTFSPRELRRVYRRFTVAFLRRLLQRRPEAEEEWERSVAREISRLEDDPSAIAWETGLPFHIEESLLPYRERLERGYRPAINCFELPVGDRGGRRRWTRW